MKTIITVVVALALASCTRVVRVPVQTAQAAAQSTPESAKQSTPEQPQNRAALVAEIYASKDPAMKCMPWTGTGTAFGGVDAMFCVSPTEVTYIAAANDAPPMIKPILSIAAEHSKADAKPDANAKSKPPAKKK